MTKGALDVDPFDLREAITLFTRRNNFSLLEKLIDEVGINTIIKYGVALPLWHRILKGMISKKKLAKILDYSSLDINAQDHRGNTFLHQLETYTPFKGGIHNQDDHMLSILNIFKEKGFDFSLLNESKESILHKLVKYPKVSKFMLEQKNDPNQSNKYGITPFMQACSVMKSDYDFTMWFQNGAEINKMIDNSEAQYYGWVPLFFAIKNQNKELVEDLIREGADLNYTSDKGRNAFVVALDYGSEDIVELLKGHINDPYDEPNVVESMINFQARQQNWEKTIEWVDKINTKKIQFSGTFNNISIAYRKLGDKKNMVLYIEKCIEQFGYNNEIWDNLINNYLFAEGLDQKVIALWETHMDTFQPDQDPAANILAQMIVPYHRVGQYQKAIDMILPFVEKAKDTEISKPGMLEFNVACTFAMIKDTENTLKYGLEAVSKGYGKESFLEQDFDRIRSESLFQHFINFIDTKVLYCYLENKEQNTTLYAHYSETLEIITFDGKKYASYDQNTENSFELFLLFQEKIEFYKKKGYIISTPDFKKTWLPALDILFQEIKKETKTPVGEIRIEWNDSYFEDPNPTFNPMERTYYCYTDNGFEIDFFQGLLYIPLEKYHNDVISEAIQLPSFKKLQKKNKVKVIQSEHDGGDEFIFEW